MLEYAALVGLAIVPIHLGALSSVKAPRVKRDARTSKSNSDDSDEDEEDDEAETITSRDAMFIPIIAAIALCTLFLAFKYLDKDLLNRLLSYYFAVAGCAGAVRMFAFLTKISMGKVRYSKLGRYKLTLQRKSDTLFNFKFTNSHVLFTIASIALTGASLNTKNFLLSNFFGAVFCFNAIGLIKLDSFQTGFIMLIGLFVYDIYFVFGTKVMVSVARDFEAPIKMVWPKDVTQKSSMGMAMLGLGDIAVPGLFIALALRFDYHLSTLQANKEDNKLKIAIPTPTSGAYPKTYYSSTLIAYLTGLITTIIVMHKFQHAQPALLYLSPACCLSVISVATWKRQLRHLFAYAEEPNEANGHAQGKAANAENLSADASSMLSAGKLAAEKAATKRHTPTTQAGERTGESDGALADDEGANLGKDREEKCKNG